MPVSEVKYPVKVVPRHICPHLLLHAIDLAGLSVGKIIFLNLLR